MTERLTLPAKLGCATAKSLADDLCQMRGQPTELDASQVDQVAVPGLQVLLSAAKSWTKDGQPLHLISVPAAFDDQISLLGLTREMFTNEVCET